MGRTWGDLASCASDRKKRALPDPLSTSLHLLDRAQIVHSVQNALTHAVGVAYHRDVDVAANRKSVENVSVPVEP